MARGRKPTPKAVLQLRGSGELSRHGERAELPPSRPEPPRPLSLRARVYWDDFTDQLYPAGIISAVDAAALARLCEMSEEYEQVKRDVDAHGMVEVVETKAGEVRRARPEVKILRDLRDALGRLEAQFGLTPSSRSGIKVAPKQTTDDRAKRFFGG